MLENIRLSLRGIWSHKLRSFLTMLGVIIGIASIIAIVSIVEGTNKKLEKSLVGAGNNVTTVQVVQGEGSSWAYDMSEGVPDGIPQITDGELEQLSRIEGVKGVTAFNQRQNWGNDIYYGNESVNNSTVYGVDQSFFDTMQSKLVNGRWITEEEYASGKKVVIIDQSVVNTIFSGENPIGSTLEIKQEPFIIVGVVKAASSDTKSEDEKYESINDYYNEQYSSGGNGIYVPGKVWPIIYQFDEPEAVGLAVEDTKQMATVGKEAADIMNTYITSTDYQYASINSAEDAEQLKTLTNAIRLMLVSIASLSLLVGGIGVMNIMLVSVTERTSEIGLKKALGAKRRVIMAQFLTESVVLTSVGGLIGVVVGIILGKIISFVVNLDFGVSIPWILISVGFSMGIGIIFGAIPANRAAKLNPIDALRRE